MHLRKSRKRKIMPGCGPGPLKEKRSFFHTDTLMRAACDHARIVLCLQSKAVHTSVHLGQGRCSGHLDSRHCRAPDAQSKFGCLRSSSHPAILFCANSAAARFQQRSHHGRSKDLHTATANRSRQQLRCHNTFLCKRLFHCICLLFLV